MKKVRFEKFDSMNEAMIETVSFGVRLIRKGFLWNRRDCNLGWSDLSKKMRESRDRMTLQIEG